MSHGEPADEHRSSGATGGAGADLTQGFLLPEGLALHPALVVAAAAVVADRDEAASGDWFDAVPVPGGRLGLVVGDVAGRGVSALAAMSQLRAVLGFLLSDGLDPAACLTRLAGYAERLGPAAIGARACVAVLDPAEGVLRYASAGHLAPTLLSRGADAVSLPPTGEGCLGLESAFTLRQYPLTPGDVVLLTSGTRPVRAGSEVWAHGTPEADQLCRRVLDDLVAEAGRDDDSVVVTARVRREPVPTYETTLPAIPDTVAVVRRGLGEWLATTGMSAVDASSLMQAAIELVTNAVEHAYPSGTDHRRTQVRVHCALDGDGLLRLQVADGGRWAADGEPTIPVTTEPGGPRGRGLFLARAFVDRLTLEAGDAGTVARIEHRPVRPPVLLTAVGGAPRGASSAGEGFSTEHVDGVLHFTGSVDATVTDDFRLLVGRASRGGISPLVLDLTRVTALASGAVGALVELGAGARDGTLHLVAKPGSTAHTVLELSGLPVR